MEFIFAKILKKDYRVWGNFYNLKYSNGSEIECRNTLEIYNKSNLNITMNKNTPDAVFIMMNPGKSRPKNKAYKPPTVSELDLINNKSVKVNLVETIPDITQYQIMRIMKAKDWQHVRVLNLSDYRNAKSSKFYEKIKTLNKCDENCIHSIFSQKRIKELDSLINFDKRTKQIVSWGVNSALDDLITMAILSKKINNRIGYGKGGNYYFNASPRIKNDKIKWLENILVQI